MEKKSIKDYRLIKKIIKNKSYTRLRQYFWMPEPKIVDDRKEFDDAEIISIEWPDSLVKPVFGIVPDYEPHPRWTRFCRFLDNNNFQYDSYNIHAHDWIEKAQKFDIILGFFSNSFSDLIEIKDKYFFLETFLKKSCYPSFLHAFLYENKQLEAFICNIAHLPFAKTHISHDKNDALELIKNLKYPVVSKIDPSSGSVGVDLVKSRKQARKIIDQAFSNVGRKTHVVNFRQKNYIYFQDFIPNDGYDIRVILSGNMAFGYYRKTLIGDFRASGMNLVEKRALPAQAIKIAWEFNKIIKSPMLVVDMLHGLDGNYHVIEYSPTCLMESPDQLLVDDVSGFYMINDDGSSVFRPGKYWIKELALKEFLLNDYLPKKLNDKNPNTKLNPEIGISLNQHSLNSNNEE